MQIGRTTLRGNDSDGGCGWSHWFRGGLLITLALLAVASHSFAQGKKDDQLLDDFIQEKKETAKKLPAKSAGQKKKLPLEIGPVLPRFGQDVGELATEGPVLLVKPGHWSATQQQMKANFADFLGQVSAELVDDSLRPVPLENLRFGLSTTRNVVLAKGRAKRVDCDLFIPQKSPATRLVVKLVDDNTSSEVFQAQPALVRLPAYQYQLVVLAKEPERYAFLKVTNSIRAPWEEEFNEASVPHYRVALVKGAAVTAIAENPLAWTAIAYVVWDEVDPTRLSTEQQEAFVDWIHWGGRLIVNGPDSLATLRGSFLDPLLPAEDSGPREFTAAELGPWSAYWGNRVSGARVSPLSPPKPLPGIRLKPLSTATELAGGGGLFYENTVGRGSVVVSAIQLTHRDLINWPGYDGFLNGGLLRRPRRVFSVGPYGGPCATWHDNATARLDAHLTSPVRLFGRDAQAAANTVTTGGVTFDQFGVATDNFAIQTDRMGGVAAWDDFSPVAQVAREHLLEAAGVKIPGAGFVLSCLACYLLVLVPFNWLIFHTIGRVEWAWAAVPLIALLGTWVVVKQAQLDIGFVRAQTEVDLLELHGSNPRGILTRYAALYSSLSTTYDIAFPDIPSAVVLPFPANQNDPTDWLQSVRFEKRGEPHLENLTVASAATRLVHAEQMIPLKGPVRLGTSSRGQQQIENRTQYHLRDCAVVRRTVNAQGEPRYEGCWLGDLRPGNSALTGLIPLVVDPSQVPFARERASGSLVRERHWIAVDSLLRLAFRLDEPTDPATAQREELRFVGIIAGALPGMEVNPSASQVRGTTVVLAHLAFGPLPAPLPDVNNITDVVTKTAPVGEN